MQVLFDLRPPHLVQSQETRVDPIRLLSVLFFVVFVLLSIFNIAFTTLQLNNVRSELARLRGEETRVTDNNDRLGASIGSMREFRDRIKAYLAFTRQELPTVEFMAALEGAVPRGLKIANLEIRPGSALMRGSALTDQDIIDFGAKLDGMRNIVRKVDAPVTTRGTLGTRMISDFSMTCSIRSITDIADTYPEQIEDANESEGGR
ncbi:hypothetical protein LJC31_00075 [Synergistaceae bacterium OttesenSCG-928-I11]|nr:hypothetical protein [Synergistaceae bacterium OttesenSCG-928-I11]